MDYGDVEWVESSRVVPLHESWSEVCYDQLMNAPSSRCLCISTPDVWQRSSLIMGCFLDGSNFMSMEIHACRNQA